MVMAKLFWKRYNKVGYTRNIVKQIQQTYFPYFLPVCVTSAVILQVNFQFVYALQLHLFISILDKPRCLMCLNIIKEISHSLREAYTEYSEKENRF